MHCGMCGVCVEELDHHCVFYGKCIARDNIDSFNQAICCFIASMLFYTLLVIYD